MVDQTRHSSEIWDFGFEVLKFRVWILVFLAASTPPPLLVTSCVSRDVTHDVINFKILEPRISNPKTQISLEWRLWSTIIPSGNIIVNAGTGRGARGAFCSGMSQNAPVEGYFFINRGGSHDPPNTLWFLQIFHFNAICVLEMCTEKMWRQNSSSVEPFWKKRKAIEVQFAKTAP